MIVMESENDVTGFRILLTGTRSCSCGFLTAASEVFDNAAAAAAAAASAL